jgi:hypothetical protein
MAKKITFNPLEGKFDVVDDDIQEVAAAPTTGAPGTLYIDTSNPTNSYYFSGGHRYKLTATLDDPASVAGSPMGLLLALTYAS